MATVDKMKQKAVANPGPMIKAAISQIAALSEQKQFESATAAARKLHAAYPNRADVNDCLSLALVDERKTGEALPFAEAAVRIEPRNPAYLVNFGRLLLDMHNVEKALPVLERARRAKPTPPEAAWAIGRFYFDIGQAEKSIPYFEEAQQHVEPAKLADVKAEFLEALRACDRIAEAEQLLDELAVLDDRPPALLLSVRSSLRKTRIDDPVAQSLLQSINAEDVDKPEYSPVLLQLGRIYENSGDYDQAFRHFELSKKSRTGRFRMQDFEAEVDDLIRTFTPDVFDRFGEAGSDSEQPVFVVGMPRSGTTMTEQIIGAHPDAQGVGELSRIRNLMRKLCPPGNSERFVRMLEEASPESFRQVPESYLSLLNFLAPGKKRQVDKMPHNFMAVGFIALCFPRARIVHVHRNPLDNFISAYQNAMNEFHSYSYDQEVYGQYYRVYQKLMSHWQAVLPGRIFDWPYDQVVVEPEHYIRKLVEHLGLPWHDDCLRFHEKATTVKTFSMHQVRNPISPKSVGRWKNYAAHLQPIRQVLGM